MQQTTHIVHVYIRDWSAFDDTMRKTELEMKKRKREEGGKHTFISKPVLWLFVFAMFVIVSMIVDDVELF